ncbi:MAG TPA: helix-turn-helix domain-containing protein [Solirubrobacteraceae bacterium]|nr:helix-turn-helix domain-containing protein [Solirubrobacteraceae bacterium]
MSCPLVKMTAVSPHPEGPAETIGQRLRRLRHERGLSQRELASPGVSYAYISRIEAGARRPSVKALRMLARKLGVSADYLETGSEIRDTDERELRIADAELELRLAEDTGTAEATLRGLRDDAVAAGDTVAAARATIALGLAAAVAGRNAEAVERLEAGLELTPVSPSARPDVFAMLGRAYSATGRSDQAVALFERCLAEVAEDTPEDFAARVRFASYLSYALTDLNELDRAQAVLDGALDEAEAITDGYSQVRLYWSLARLHDVRGRPAAALDYVRRAIALLAVTDDTLHLARAHLLCGDILMTQGRPQDAGRHFELAERLFGPSPGRSDLASLYTHQAKRAAALGDGEEAVRRAQAAVDTLRDEDPAEQGNARWALAEGLALTGDADGAHDAFGKATSLLGEHGRRRDHVEAYRAWGKFLRRAGREDDALEVLERAADLAAEPVAANGSDAR